MTSVAILLTMATAVIALWHVAWALGVTWPFGNERDLARAVVGSPSIKRMPGTASCLAVALALAAAAAWPWAGGLGVLHPVGLAGLASVFLARGAASYVPPLRRLAPEEPFATYDRRLYAPLCLTLGAGFAALLMGAA